MSTKIASKLTDSQKNVINLNNFRSKRYQKSCDKETEVGRRNTREVCHLRSSNAETVAGGTQTSSRSKVFGTYYSLIVQQTKDLEWPE